MKYFVYGQLISLALLGAAIGRGHIAAAGDLELGFLIAWVPLFVGAFVDSVNNSRGRVP